MKKLFLIFLIFFCVRISASAQQQYPGFRTGNYIGVNGVFFNPANVVDSRYKWDVNLIGINVGFGNNNANFKTSNISDLFSDKAQDIFLNSSDDKNLSALANIDILGPSFLININKKNAIAITTRARILGNVSDVNGKLINSIMEDYENQTAKLPYTINSNENQRVVLNGWSEIGASWGYVIYNEGKHFLKAGITAKYLMGTMNSYTNVNKLNGKVEADVIKQDVYLTNASGSISTAVSGIKDLENVKPNDFTKPNGSGFGGDIGFVYEYRPDEELNSQNHLNKYKFKVGLAIMDLGAIKYKPTDEYTANYDIHITNGQQFFLSELDNSTNISEILNKYPQFFTKNPNAQNYSMALPTTLRGNFDYHIYKGLYADVTGQFAFKSDEKTQNAFYHNSVTLTPRFENTYVGVYLPINYNSLTNFNAGLSLRLGPLYIGSGSILSLAMGQSKQLDAFFGIRFGGLHKMPKKEVTIALPPPAPIDTDGDGITDDMDKCPNIPGVAKYEGCPIPDTDGDGINDEEDKCPSIAGLLKYYGCPVPDTDGDGINDELDKCPNVPGIAKYEGCPIPDTDGDGINDEIDKCPTRPGIPENNGCPEVKIEIIKKAEYAAKHILFLTGKATLLKSSKVKLNEVVKIMNEDADLKLSIEGHTDNVGKSEANQTLSENRAASVKTYLISQGIDENRLTSEGFGDSNPVDTNKTAAGRKNNRRVELLLSY